MPGLRLASSEPNPEIIRQLNSFKPDVLGGYASIVRILAEEQIVDSLNIHPHAIYTSSEVLTFETRQRIEMAWGCKPFNQYGSTETGGLAAECEQHRGMHLFEDRVIAEVVDQDNQPLPPGVFGEKLLITDIQGCPEDILSFPAVACGEVVLHPPVFHRVMDIIPSNGWQVVQEADRLIVLLSGVREDFADEALVNMLRQALQAQGAVVPLIMVKLVTSIPQTATGKAPLIKSNRSA